MQGLQRTRHSTNISQCSNSRVVVEEVFNPLSSPCCFQPRLCLRPSPARGMRVRRSWGSHPTLCQQLGCTHALIHQRAVAHRGAGGNGNLPGRPAPETVEPYLLRVKTCGSQAVLHRSSFTSLHKIYSPRSQKGQGSPVKLHQMSSFGIPMMMEHRHQAGSRAADGGVLCTAAAGARRASSDLQRRKICL